MKKAKVCLIGILVGILILFFGGRMVAMNLSFGDNGLEVLNSIPNEIFESVSECATNQQGLYGYIESHYGKGATLPVNPHEIVRTLYNEQHMSLIFTACPCGTETEAIAYIIHPAAYGNRDAVFIEDSRNRHPTTFWLWYRGVHPQVQTMGDGRVQIFKDGKIAVLNADQ